MASEWSSDRTMRAELLFYLFFYKKFAVKLKVKNKTSKKFKKGISFVFTLVDLLGFTIQ